MTNAVYSVAVQPISIYGYRFAKVTVTTAGTAATTIDFGDRFVPIAKLDGKTATAGTTGSIAANFVGDLFYIGQ